MITITDMAAKKILDSVREAQASGDGLRVRVVGGGCSGLQYKMAIDSEHKGDKVFEHQGAKLYVDRKSYLYLNGTQLDYSEGLMNVGRASKPSSSVSRQPIRRGTKVRQFLSPLADFLARRRS